MSIDATPGPGRFAVAPAVTAPERVLPSGWGARRRYARTAERWREWAGLDLSGSTPVVLASAALGLVVFTSLLLVSLAAARYVEHGFLVPAAKAGNYPSWIAGPTGVLTSWFAVSAHTERVLFTAAIATMLVAYLVVVYAAPRLRVTWVLGAIVLVHVIFVLSPPLSLTDVFNYLNYGRMEVVYHLNPYMTIPALEPHTDPTFLLSNWHGLLSPYGPLFTVFTMALVPLGVAGSFWAMKLALMVASLGTVFLVYRCADLLGRDPLTAAVIVGLNPIVLVWGLGGDHNDFLMIFFLVLGFWLLLRANAMRIGKRARPPRRAPTTAVGADLRRFWAWLDGMPRPLVVGEPAAWMEIGAGIALVAAVAIKASSAVLVPIIVAGAARRIRVATGVVIGLVAATAMTVIAFGVNLPNVGQQDRLVIPDGLPNLIGLAFGFGGYTSQMRTVFTLLLVAVIAGAVLWVWRTRRWLTACGVATLALLLTLGWTLPWYILWLLPFAALSRSRGLRVAATLLGIYIYLAWMPYSSEVLGFLHINPATTNLGAQETNFMNALLF
jgi:4-amino-4-deoxy-L-arabinose transferase-like glycosyltransferase